jgi:hypothetical protein
MMAQVARKKVAEKNARRVRGAIGLDNLKRAEKAHISAQDRCPILDEV